MRQKGLISFVAFFWQPTVYSDHVTNANKIKTAVVTEMNGNFENTGI